jgi:deazaflavin-dependent oxidoreductase (nitroreductase family)
MPDVTDFNRSIIEEFRTSGGELGGNFAGAPMLLLHSTGARSGQERVNPMMYQEVGDHYAVFASKAGWPTNPDWFHNLLVHPAASIEIGSETKKVRARVASGAERDTIWTTQKERYPGFAEYEAKTDREIPVVILEPTA